MSIEKRSEFHQEVVEALLDSQAINLEALASVMARFAERALRDGESLVNIINHNAIWNCGNPGPLSEIAVLRQAGE